MSANEVDRDGETAQTRFRVANAFQAARLIPDPATAIVAGTEIAADAETFDLGEQRKLHGELTAELHEGRDSVVQQLDHREQGIELQRGIEAGAAVRQIARVAGNRPSLFGDADLQERLTEIERPADIGDQTMRGAMPRMHVRVDEPWTDQLVLGVDDAIDGTRE